MAEHMGCSSAKVSILLKELEKMNLVVEGEQLDGGSGRRVKQMVLSGDPALLVGVELGSYEIRILLADYGGTILARDKISEDSSIDDPEHVLRRLYHLIDRFMEDHAGSRGINGIALALSGVVDNREGVIHYFRNQKVWEGMALRKLVEDRYGVPCYMDDSSRAMAAAEKHWGSCRDNDYFVLLSLGVGLGAAVHMKEGIYQGRGYASEIGHMVIDPDGPRCNCGNNGCLESFASGYALESRVLRALKEGVYTSLDTRNVTAKSIIEAAEQGDKFAYGAVREMAEHLGLGISNVINIFSPEKVVLAGGLSHAGDLLLMPIRQIVRSTALSIHSRNCEIVISPLSEYAAAME